MIAFLVLGLASIIFLVVILANVEAKARTLQQDNNLLLFELKRTRDMEAAAHRHVTDLEKSIEDKESELRDAENEADLLEEGLEATTKRAEAWGAGVL